MIFKSTIDNTVIGFQRNTDPGSRNRGFICEEQTFSESLHGLVTLIARYCSKTRAHPADIIERTEVQE